MKTLRATHQISTLILRRKTLAELRTARLSGIRIGRIRVATYGAVRRELERRRNVV